MFFFNVDDVFLRGSVKKFRRDKNKTKPGVYAQSSDWCPSLYIGLDLRPRHLLSVGRAAGTPHRASSNFGIVDG